MATAHVVTGTGLGALGVETLRPIVMHLSEVWAVTPPLTDVTAGAYATLLATLLGGIVGCATGLVQKFIMKGGKRVAVPGS